MKCVSILLHPFILTNILYMMTWVRYGSVLILLHRVRFLSSDSELSLVLKNKI